MYEMNKISDLIVRIMTSDKTERVMIITAVTLCLVLIVTYILS